MSAHTYLNCGFGHPSKRYEGFLLHVEASTQHADIGEEDSDQQSDEHTRYAQTCRQKVQQPILRSSGYKICLIRFFSFQSFGKTAATSQ